ncbi:DUF3035 domain-containing protein [Primorskyibacter sp. S87]|uniref:DUF3035 domain-containing protein n=1 Tax=Primorskyibacter sp. S87 TaxID=3415126 RepID=UPI003C79ED8C
MRVALGLIILTAGLGLAGCANKGLRDLKAPGTGPDEFMIQPAKPLTAPKDYAVLPPPTPGGRNLTDINPNADAVVALGGRASALETSGIPSSDAALVTASSRYGVAQDARAVIASEDAEFRKRQGRMTRIKLFPVDRYEQVYRKEALSPSQQNQLFRNSGAATPSAPPVSE